MTMISPADMVLFAAVVREGSFTRAARKLGITKQTVSERIAKLEAEARVRLLERTTRSLRPTDAGEAYAQHCALIAAQIDEANAELSRRHSEPVGTLRVSAPVLYGRRFLAPVVTDYLCRFPDVRVDVVLADRRVNLVEEGFDLAIRVGELDDSSLRAKKLGDGYAYYVASPRFLAKYGTPTASSVGTTRCIGLSRHETWTIAGARSKVEPVLVVNDLEMACDAAVGGVGVARLPSLVCRDAVQQGRLRVLFEGAEPLVRPVYVVYPSRAYLPAKVRVFVDALTEMVEPMLPLDLPRKPSRGRTR
ncbi:MAG: LysR family transcriptional regulator [Polyangiaceae bacterium]